MFFSNERRHVGAVLINVSASVMRGDKYEDAKNNCVKDVLRGVYKVMG